MSACIVWTGAYHEGYPMRGRRRAHRIAYEQTHGAIPAGYARIAERRLARAAA